MFVGSIRFVKVMTFFFVLKRFLGGFQSRTCVTLRVLLVKHSLSKVHLLLWSLLFGILHKLIVSVILQCVVTFRKNEDTKRAFHVSEDDVLRSARRVLPATNFFISKTSELFSGEPSMTLKVNKIKSVLVIAMCWWFTCPFIC